MNKKALLSVILTFCSTSIKADNREQRIRGSILGAFLGDAFGRLADYADTYDVLRSAYGEQGIKTIKQLPNDSFALNESNERLLQYSSNVMISAMSCAGLASNRMKKRSHGDFVYQLGSCLQEFYGERGCGWNSSFAQWFARSRSVYSLASNPTLSSAYWVSQGNDDTKHYGRKYESDATSLARILPMSLVYSDNLDTARFYTEYCTLMTHSHPGARSAAAAYTVGLYYLINDATIETAVQQMIMEAEKYDRIERRIKPNARKIWSRRYFDADYIAKDEMLTSDLIRFAYQLALEEHPIDEIFGHTNKQNDMHRSPRGFLLGYHADEAVAAAVYLLVKYGQDYKRAIGQGTLSCGNASLICFLTGGLTGAYKGYELMKEDCETEFSALEHKREIDLLIHDVLKGYRTAPEKLSLDDFDEAILERSDHLYKNVESRGWWPFIKKASLISIASAVGYAWYQSYCSTN